MPEWFDNAARGTTDTQLSMMLLATIGIIGVAGMAIIASARLRRK